MQIRLPGLGKTEDNWINVARDLGHVFRNLVKEAVTSIPEDAIVPKPSEDEIREFVQSITGLIRRSEAGKITPEEAVEEIEKWEPGLASAFKHYLTVMMFQKYVLWRRDLMPMRRVEEDEEEKDERTEDVDKVDA